MCNQQHETEFEPPSGIDIHSKANVGYWADKLGVSETALMDLIGNVGPQIDRVQRALGKYTPTSNMR